MESEENNIEVYQCHVFIWPEVQFQTLSVHDSCCANMWKQNQTHSTDPWQGHTHFGHPAAIVLAMSDGMDDLEVAFQGDDYQTEPFSRQAGNCYSFKDHTNYVVENTIIVVITPYLRVEYFPFQSYQVRREQQILRSRKLRSPELRYRCIRSHE